jgi:prevent-host-death family protein
VLAVILNVVNADIREIRAGDLKSVRGLLDAAEHEHAVTAVTRYGVRVAYVVPAAEYEREHQNQA